MQGRENVFLLPLAFYGKSCYNIFTVLLRKTFMLAVLAVYGLVKRYILKVATDRQVFSPIR